MKKRFLLTSLFLILVTAAYATSGSVVDEMPSANLELANVPGGNFAWPPNNGHSGNYSWPGSGLQLAGFPSGGFDWPPASYDGWPSGHLVPQLRTIPPCG